MLSNVEIKKRNYILIALIIVLLSLAIGYAVLNDQLTMKIYENYQKKIALSIGNGINEYLLLLQEEK